MRLGDSNTTLRVGDKNVALEEWVDSQGFLKTSFIHTISLTPTTTNAATSISFSANTDNSGSNFMIGRAISGLTSNEFGIGHPTAGSAFYGIKMDAWGKCSFAREVSISGILDVNSGLYAPPQFTSRSGGTRIVLWGAVNQSSGDYAIGISGSTFMEFNSHDCRDT